MHLGFTSHIFRVLCVTDIAFYVLQKLTDFLAKQNHDLLQSAREYSWQEHPTTTCNTRIATYKNLNIAKRLIFAENRENVNQKLTIQIPGITTTRWKCENQFVRSKRAPGSYNCPEMRVKCRVQTDKHQNWEVKSII